MTVHVVGRGAVPLRIPQDIIEGLSELLGEQVAAVLLTAIGLLLSFLLELLFGLLAVELAVKLENGGLKGALAAGFLLVAFVFVYRSFYGMRIPVEAVKAEAKK